MRNVYNQIRKDGHVHRGHIGVGLQTITPTLAKGLGLAQDWGVVVSDIEPEGPAKTAGVQDRRRDSILEREGGGKRQPTGKRDLRPGA